jgi:signal transduction histidine kinase
MTTSHGIIIQPIFPYSLPDNPEFVKFYFILYNNTVKENNEYLHKFEVLQRISVFISSINSLQKLLTLIMEESKRILSAEASSLLLYDKEEKVLFFKVATGEKGSKVKTIRLKLGQGIAGICAKEKRIINVKDASKDRRFFSSADKKSRFHTRSILAVPLAGKKGRLLGVLEVLNKKDGRPFDKKDEELMSIIAGQASLSVENAQLYIESMKNAKMAGVGETMLSLSHDIKNILNGLYGGVSLLDDTMASVEGEYVQDAWGIVKSNVNRISDLILDMLNYSSKKEPFLQRVHLSDFIKSTVSVYNEKIKEKRIQLIYELDDSIKEVDIDTTGMQRVILNLFSNAYEIVPEGTGIIKVSTRNIPDKGRFTISIEDNGAGISPENLKKIFDIFFTTKGHKGTGLGLAVVKKIVTEHKGTVDVASECGKGTVFTLELPCRYENPKS